jgi:antitoxin component of RelBE/YafQ-DinJ toxin-antitoxin module
MKAADTYVRARIDSATKELAADALAAMDCLFRMPSAY